MVKGCRQRQLATHYTLKHKPKYNPFTEEGGRERVCVCAYEVLQNAGIVETQESHVGQRWHRPLERHFRVRRR
jgi:hypothetical protein